MQHCACLCSCLLVLACSISLVVARHPTDNVVLKGVEIDVKAFSLDDSSPRQLLQTGGPKCGQQFSLVANTVQAGYYYFGCFREFLASIPCVTFGTRIRNAPGVAFNEGWMTITNLNKWKNSKNQISDWPKFVESDSVTNCTGDILGGCDMAGRFPTPTEDTYYCNVVYVLGGENVAAKRVTRVKLGGLDKCDDC